MVLLIAEALFSFFFFKIFFSFLGKIIFTDQFSSFLTLISIMLLSPFNDFFFSYISVIECPFGFFSLFLFLCCYFQFIILNIFSFLSLSMVIIELWTPYLLNFSIWAISGLVSLVSLFLHVFSNLGLYPGYCEWYALDTLDSMFPLRVVFIFYFFKDFIFFLFLPKAPRYIVV